MTAIINAVNWTEWVTVGGPSPYTFNYTTDDSVNATNLADQYIALGGFASPFNATATYKSYYANQQVIFHLRLIARLDDLSLNIMERIDNDLNCTTANNPEITQRWFPTAIALGYIPAFGPAFDYVS